MISYLEGVVISYDERSVILKCGAVGYRVFVSSPTLDTLRHESAVVKIFTHHAVREDSQDLYGFLSQEELRFAQLLLEVSGLGPRTTQLVLGMVSPATASAAILKGTSEVFERVPGIGTRLAKKIIIELEPKLKRLGFAADDAGVERFADDEDAIEALKSLGYTRREAQGALKKLPNEVAGASRRVEEALKLLGRRS